MSDYYKNYVWIVITEVRGQWKKFSKDHFYSRKKARMVMDFVRAKYSFARFKVAKCYDLTKKENYYVKQD
jgi:hypothetical protein